MALICHLAFTKRCTCQETQEQASSCSMNRHASTHQPSREVTYSLRPWKKTQKHLSPFETRKNHHELLLQEDTLIFLLHSEHIFTPPNFNLVADGCATSESSLYRSDGDFSRTDVLSSQYTGAEHTNVGVWNRHHQPAVQIHAQQKRAFGSRKLSCGDPPWNRTGTFSVTSYCAGITNWSAFR